MFKCDRRFSSDYERCVPECDCRPARPKRCCPCQQYCCPNPYPPYPYPPYPYPPFTPYEPEFKTSYLEAMLDTQRIESGANFVFDVTEGNMDVAGTDITAGSDGTTFILHRAGLYHIEWSLSVSEGSAPMLAGLLENGAPASAANILSAGNVSFGALVNVKKEDLPYEISLHNFSNPLSISSGQLAGNTAGSIRILRFADNER